MERTALAVVVDVVVSSAAYDAAGIANADADADADDRTAARNSLLERQRPRMPSWSSWSWSWSFAARRRSGANLRPTAEGAAGGEKADVDDARHRAVNKPEPFIFFVG